MNKKEILLRAKKIAYTAHEGMKRWGGEPYIVHPQRVAESLRDHSPTIQAIGWLHDVIEDTSYTEADLAFEVGSNVAERVAMITHRENETYAEYIARVGEDFIATLVKLADLEDNLSDLDDSPRNRQRKQKYELARLYLKKAQGIE